MKRSAPMKRSGFKRKRDPMARQPFKVIDPREERRKLFDLPVPTQEELADQLVRVHFGISGPNAVFAPQEKREPIRDEAYRRWVASMPCIRCGVSGLSQAAHPNQGRGLGQKADDDLCFPLCSTRPGILGCHAEHDRLVGMTLEERRQREIDYVATVKAMHEGRILPFNDSSTA